MGIRWSRGVMMAAAILGATGCYQSDYPLDPVPLIDFNPAALGVWRCLPLDGEAGEPPVLLSIARSSRDRLYDAVWQEPGAPADHYEAYASVLQGTTLLNVRERDERGAIGKWTFVRYTLLRANVLHLQVVADSAMTGVANSATAIRAAVERQRAAATLYTDVAVCARVSPAP